MVRHILNRSTEKTMLHSLLQNFLHFKGLVFAGIITLFGISNFAALAEKAQWPQVDAVVLNSASTPDPSDPKKAHLDFSYRYQIAGRSTKSSSVFASIFRQEPKFVVDVTEVVSRFPIGSSVSAFVNPSDPFEAYLDLNPSTIDYVLPGLGVAGLLCFSVYHLTERRKKRAGSDNDGAVPRRA